MSEASTERPEGVPVAAAPDAGYGDVVLAARDIAKRYRMGSESIDVVRGVSVELRAGEAVAVMGRSGAGKSTLLHMLGLLDRPDTGALSIGGVETVGLSVGERAALRNRQVGFVFQFYHLFGELNALENAVMPLMISHGIADWSRVGRDCRRRAEELLVELGLGDRLRHRPSQLSGGERQRIAIARALVGHPSLLLCDEPTGNLDEQTGEIIESQLFGMARRHGAALVVVTHDPLLAARADRTLHMHDGRLEDAE